MRKVSTESFRHSPVFSGAADVNVRRSVLNQNNKKVEANDDKDESITVQPFQFGHVAYKYK